MDAAELQEKLDSVGYVADPDLAMALWLMETLDRPLLIEGEAGVGKTDVAKALAQVLGAELIRLQCYEGLDANAAVYEWDYQRQLLAIKVWESDDRTAEEKESHIFDERFLLKRPLLNAISRETPPVLLIDEIDRADEEFEAYLLEVLSDYQISIPELGTVTAKSIPKVVLTSNSTREISDALRRRCLYHHLDYPDAEKELRVVAARLPDIGRQLASQVVGFVQALRRQDLERKPGIAETLDWARALLGLGVGALHDDPDAVRNTLLCLLKTRADRESVTPEIVDKLIAKAG